MNRLNTSSISAQPPRRAVQGLGIWSLYFFVKLLLGWQGTLRPDWLANLAFALALLMPFESKRIRQLRNTVAVILGIALLYHDSWLPPPDKVMGQLSLLQGFSPAYLFELAGRLVSLSMIVWAVVLLAGWRLLSRYLRLGTVAILALVAMNAHQLWPQQAVSAPMADGAEHAVSEPTQSPDAQLAAFYRDQGQRLARFQGPLADPGFDVLLIHVCSLSWDDLRAAGMDHHPLLDRFDFLFTDFNSASPYSGPSALRVLRASCGQSSHSDLYKPAPSSCYLFQNLAALGFKTELALNHDGSFDEFLKQIRTEGHLDVPLMTQKDLPVALRSFDNSPIYSDYAVLARWLQQRQNDATPYTATYYNTISLHDGNRIPGNPGLNTLDSYKTRAGTLLDDLGRFIDTLQQSHRKMILILVPEHGAALRGDKLQFSGLREIPTPHITIVPAAIKVIGGTGRPAQLRIDQPVSYLAISTILSRMMNRSPFGSDYQPSNYTADLPTTPFVAESASSIVMQSGQRYLLKQGGGNWSEYPL
jgi:cellulose synthase operon protein YhjU